MLNCPMVTSHRRGVSLSSRGSEKALRIRSGMQRCSSSPETIASASTILQCRQMGSTALTTAMGSSQLQYGPASSEQKLLTFATLPKSMTRLSKTQSPLTVCPAGKVSPVTE